MHWKETGHIGPVKAPDPFQVTIMVVLGAIKVIDPALRATAHTEVGNPVAPIETVPQGHQDIRSLLQEIAVFIEARGPVVQEARGAHTGALAIVPTIPGEVTEVPGALADRHHPEVVPQVVVEAAAAAEEVVAEEAINSWPKSTNQ